MTERLTPRPTVPVPSCRLDHHSLGRSYSEGIGLWLLSASWLRTGGVEEPGQRSEAGQTVELPLDGQAYECLLKKKIKESKYVKQTREVNQQDMSKSFR